ncbi:hypothetical protein R1flu_022816 [Riccia fluitans]|uniref:Uncharacterized protein n=1 Tax=Riccia fluitans TaxID=41844 RepID=A0ABD1XQA1_9MARC
MDCRSNEGGRKKGRNENALFGELGTCFGGKRGEHSVPQPEALVEVSSVSVSLSPNVDGFYVLIAAAKQDVWQLCALFTDIKAPVLDLHFGHCASGLKLVSPDFFPESAKTLALRILDELAQELEKRPRPVVFATFSGGYIACLWKIYQVFQGTCDGLDFTLAKYKLVRTVSLGRFTIQVQPILPARLEQESSVPQQSLEVRRDCSS